MEKELHQTKLVLASASPRRKQLLNTSGIPFLVLISDIEEKPKEGESAKDYVRRNAQEKALAVSSRLTQDEFVLSADTIVVTEEGHILEKPLDNAHAAEMLHQLSGRFHLVYTAYSLFQNKKEFTTKVIETKVFFRKLSTDEISSYIATGEPFDKAGSYGIQGAAMSFVERIEGSYTNVMGLPLSHVIVDLETLAGIKPFAQAPLL